MKKNIMLIAGSQNTKRFLLEQLKEFIPDSFNIEAYASDEEEIPFIKCDLLIISSFTMKDELEEKCIKFDARDVIVCERSVNFDYIESVTDIPVNEEVLLVNDDEDTVKSSINDLIELGLNHIKYYPYYPGIQSYKKLRTAITPGEPDKVPPCVEKVINLGPRMIDMNTLNMIMDKLNLTHRDTKFITRKYMQKIINISKRIAEINNDVNTLNIYLNNIVDSLVNGILVIDDNGYIKYANEEMKKLFSIEKNIANKNIKNIVDKEKIPYFLSADVFENKSISIMGVNVKMTKFNVPNSNNIVITTNRDKKESMKNSFNQDILIKGYYAKHNFENIIGENPVLEDTKNIAKKLSKTDLTVLIEGESGTGKELFASSIHNNSRRKFGPFLAINFSALPDELIESELFGYEEGAFTGAKKGGKVGLFELADGGTIFLDEIGDVSPKLQTKLLRVLQEKEIMPIGGSAIRRVDVRIIAATNKNLKSMVLEKQFRADLYYRLKIGYVYIPPLRSRISDLDILVPYFIRNETAANIVVSQRVMDEFKRYEWLGNVRELESTIKYMLAVRLGDSLSISDLPARNFFEGEMVIDCEVYDKDEKSDSLSYELYVILESIQKLIKNNNIAGRAKISENLKEKNYNVTQSQIRTRLAILQNSGYIYKEARRRGVFLSEKGIKYLKNKT